MKEFFKVKTLEQVFEYKSCFRIAETENIPLSHTDGRVLAENILSDVDLPDFTRATMDGYAVRAASTFGASEANPAYLDVKGVISMGEIPTFSLNPGEAARISTGGMLPRGADAVVMIEHTEMLDNTAMELCRSVAPGQHVVEIGEDMQKGETVLSAGQQIRPQETGLLAALGRKTVTVYKEPVISVVSTGDEIVPVEKFPGPGQIRDINTHTLQSLIKGAGAVPVSLGIVPDNYEMLFETCSQALAQSDMVLISGGSSVGTRDFTIDVLSAMPDAEILVHGISISPGKPTILAKVGGKAFWGLPGHVVSAMVVFSIVVRPFVAYVRGLRHERLFRVSARLGRNIPSAQGRTDFVRVRLTEKDDMLCAEPILGKSGLIRTMTEADGLIEIGMNTEGLDKDTEVSVLIV